MRSAGVPPAIVVQLESAHKGKRVCQGSDEPARCRRYEARSAPQSWSALLFNRSRPSY